METKTTEEVKATTEITPITVEPSVAAVEVGKDTPTPSIADSKEYKGLQTRYNRLTEELTRAKANNASLTTIEQRTQKVEQVLGLMVEALAGNQDEDTPVPTRASLKQRYDALNRKAEAPLAGPTPEQLMEYHTLNKLTRKAKLDPESDEVAEARTLYQTKGFDAAEEYLEGLVEKKKAPKETPDEMEARITAKVRKELGLDSVDTSSPSSSKGKTLTVEDITKGDKFDAREVIKAMSEGRIKTKR